MRFARLFCPLLVAATLLVGRGAQAAKDDDDREVTHTVANGQTLGAIAKRYRVSVAELREANDLAPGQRLKIGTKLVVPVHEKPGKKSHRDDDEDDDRDPKTKRHKVDDDDDRSSKKHRKVDADEDDERDAKRRAKHAKDDDEDEPKRRAKHGKSTFRIQRGDETWEGKIVDRKGKATPEAMRVFERMLRFGPTGKKHDIDPRLVSLVANVSEHFGGKTIQVVSGFRPKRPEQFTPHSRHNLGDAIDFHIEGVSNEELRDYCQTFSKVGVGFYPHSSFVHLDVRSLSATWVDLSGPGERPRYQHDASQQDEADDRDTDEASSAKAAE